ncbi:hypothetical protein [Hydrocoleum sp. CS-953]|uniref:hypothetical protein n=1 Tax=Hydrocoleum sp. CS-953 TaxID=1671698 RepID=UPI00143DC23C|nr:hypothetical protein [Hydrocoleum sp. CS-953]
MHFFRDHVGAQPLYISALRLYWPALRDLSHTLLMHNRKINTKFAQTNKKVITLV